MTERVGEFEESRGLPPHFADAATELLYIHAKDFIDLQKFRIRISNRNGARQEQGFHPDPYLHDGLAAIEREAAKQVKRALEHHPLWPWLRERPGLGGARMGVVIALIRDPHRFPGQRCSEGHYFRPIFEEGAPCPVTVEHFANDASHGAGDGDPFESDGSHVACSGRLLPPRPHTGTRSLWHYCGLFPNSRDGRLANSPHQDGYRPYLKGLILGPQGIADQIVRHSTEPYCEEGYRRIRGQRLREDGTVAMRDEITARVVASKMVIGDLLAEWKRIAPL